MIPKDDFDSRLSQGLKRWAEAGEPTIDLEAYVRAQTDSPCPNLAAEAPADPVRRTPCWLRRLALPAAAVLAMLLGVVTFPMWAGAAAEWPLVGPVVTEVVLKDAGLKWAYENHLIQGSLAEVKEGDVTVRILGVMADTARTTLVYQVVGLPAHPRDGEARPIPGPGSLLQDPPAPPDVGIGIAKLGGQAAMSWQSYQETSVGLVGTVSTLPLETEKGTIELKVRIGIRESTLQMEISRAEAGRFSSEVPVNQSQTVGDVTITVKSVIYTPAETVIKYQVKKPEYWGSYSWQPQENHRLECGGKSVYPGDSHGAGDDHMEAFPVAGCTPRFVVPMVVKGEPVHLVWPLTEGATQQAAGGTITLKSWERQDGRIAFEFWSAGGDGFKGMDQLAVIDKDGQVYRFEHWKSESAADMPDGTKRRVPEFDLPTEFMPVAVQADRIGVRLEGPWTFDLPAPPKR